MSRYARNTDCNDGRDRASQAIGFFFPPRINSAQEVRESLLLRAGSVNAGVRKSGIKPGFFVGLKTGCNG
jgi:hypothetical protein